MRPGRITTTPDPRGVRITVPAPRSWPQFLVLLLWLAGWGFGVAQTYQALLEEKAKGSNEWLVLAVWLALWCSAGLAVAAGMLWRLIGKEDIVVGFDALTITKTIFGLGIPKRYTLGQIANLSMVPIANAGPNRPDRPYELRFEYAGKAQRFASGLSQSEAEQVLSQIKERVL